MSKKTHENILINVEQKISGHFHLKVERLDDDGNRVVDREYKFDNLITNDGMDHLGLIGSNSGVAQSIQVGSGSTAPQVTDTQLAAFVASAARDSNSSIINRGEWNETGGYFYSILLAQFGQGVAAGNLTEIGAGTATTRANSKLFSRALILDTNGQPTTITILPTEFLTVTYELRNYRPAVVDTTAQVTVGGVVRNLTIRQTRNTNAEYWQAGGGNPVHYAYLNNSYFGVVPYIGATSTIGAASTTPTGTAVSIATDGTVTLPYTPGNFYRDIRTNFTISQANGEIGAIACNSGVGSWQVGILPRIVKDNTMTLSITFRVSWARYTP